MATGTEKNIWHGMIYRCASPKSPNFKHYGGRGIKVCARWLKSFETFYSDMGSRPSLSHSIERRNNNGNYEPKNCYWATKSEQIRNRRPPIIVHKLPNPAIKITQTPVRWYAPTQKAFDRLMALGAPKRAIYEGWKAEHWSKVTMRKGEALGVLDGYRAFGAGIRLISKAVDRFHGHGATIVDIETGRDSRTHGHILASEATGPRRMSAEFKRKMADEKAEKRLESKAGMSKHEIQIEWKKPGIMSADERAKYLRIPRATLYAKFGKSGAAAGRRPKYLLET